MLTTALILAIGAWTVFTIYLLWYVIAAKSNAPITIQEAKALWQIHKENSACTARNWEPVSQKGDLVKGFKCECGYKYYQKKPLVFSTTAKVSK